MRTKTDYYDYNLIAVIILLIGFGLVMLYSTTSYTAAMKFGDDMMFLKKQAVFSAGAIAAAVLFSYIPYRIYWYLSGFLYILSLLLMALVRTPLGRTVNGARRWLGIGGFSFQPAEVAKIAVISFVPMLIVRMGKKYRKPANTLLAAGAGVLQAAAAYILTDNLSTAIIIMMITAFIVFVAHPKTKPFLALGFGMLAAAAGGVYFIISNEVSSSFRARRILTWLHPEQYASEGGYQVMQALYALGSGGLFGKGLGNGTQKLWAVPEAENDMIFAIICEELGIFGGVIVILLFLYLLYRLFFIAQNAPDLYSALMVTGIFGHISMQVILNICVVVNLIPTTGVTLPFLSYGGTSVVLLMAEITIALSVSRAIKFRRPEQDLWGEVVRSSSGNGTKV